MPGTDLHTPEQWLHHPDFTGIRVMDADGWSGVDAKDWSEPIGRDEFERRLSVSTIIGPVRKFPRLVVSARAEAVFAINPGWAFEAQGRTVALRVPGGYWAVKVRQRNGVWVAFAVPRNGTSGEPFDIATGPDRRGVERAGSQWTDSANSLAMGYRVVFAGTGDSIDETPLPALAWYAQVAPAPKPIEPASQHAECRQRNGRYCFVHNLRLSA